MYNLKNPEITVSTTVINHHQIEQIVDFSNSEYTMRWIINTREQQVRNALIELGWTPPLTHDQSCDQ